MCCFRDTYLEAVPVSAMNSAHQKVHGGHGMDVMFFSPRDYTPAFKTAELRTGIPDHIIKKTLQKICNKEFKSQTVELLGGNNAQLGCIKVHYYVTQKTEGSQMPWYAVSQAMIERLIKSLEDSGKICILFFDDMGSYYDCYYDLFNIKQIEKQIDKGKKWKPPVEGDKTKYRYNPKTMDKEIKIKKG